LTSTDHRVIQGLRAHPEYGVKFVEEAGVLNTPVER